MIVPVSICGHLRKSAVICVEFSDLSVSIQIQKLVRAHQRMPQGGEAHDPAGAAVVSAGPAERSNFAGSRV